MTSPALEVRGLVAHRGRTEVLHGVDLALRAGEVVALLGPNGAGKSTLLDVLGGVLEPTAGTVERAGRVATVMQAPGLASTTALANVELALAWWGVPRAERRSRAMSALDALGVADLARRRAHQLSGGERRRVHLARGLACGADVLLLDEPFAGLDPASHALMRDDVAAALRAAGRAVLVVVHDRDDAWALADRLAVMLDGRITDVGVPEDVLAAPSSPEVARLLGYDGELRIDGHVVLTHPSQVVVDADGDVEGRVMAVVPVPGGCRVHVAVDGGEVWAQMTGRPTGDAIRVRILAKPLG